MYDQMKASLFENMVKAEFIEHFYHIFNAVHAQRVQEDNFLPVKPEIIKKAPGILAYEIPIEGSIFDLDTYDYLHKFTDEILLRYYVLDVAMILFKQSTSGILSRKQRLVVQEYARAFIKSAIDLSANAALKIAANNHRGSSKVSVDEQILQPQEFLPINAFYIEVCDLVRIRKHMRNHILCYTEKHKLHNSRKFNPNRNEQISYLSKCGAGTIEEIQDFARTLETAGMFNDGISAIIQIVTRSTPKHLFKKLVKEYAKR